MSMQPMGLSSAALAGGAAAPPVIMPGNGISSNMASFMNNINQTVAGAYRGPDNMYIMDWANGLMMQAQQRREAEALAAQQAKQQAMAAQQASASAGNDIASQLQTLLQMILTLLSSQQGSQAAQ